MIIIKQSQKYYNIILICCKENESFVISSFIFFIEFSEEEIKRKEKNKIKDS